MDIQCSNVQIPLQSGSVMPALLWRPAANSKGAILVLMEAYGLTSHIQAVAEKLAAEGYTTVAPDLYYAKTPRTVFAYDERPAAMAAMDSMDILRTTQDSLSAIKFMKAELGLSDVAVLGLCFGGSLVLPISAAFPNLVAGVSMYGHCNGDWLNYVTRGMSGPLQFYYGSEDAVFSSTDVDQLENRLKECGIPYSITRMNGARHGYFNPNRKEYDATSAEVTWRHLISFFDQQFSQRSPLRSNDELELVA